jgi:crossover junction endodeoxyribonuclease RuvC
MLAAIHRGVPICEYSPKEMKLGVVGSGGATKEQVAFMVRQILRIDGRMAADESDALGLAICHAHRMKRPTAAPRNWEHYVKAHPERVKS